MPRLRTVRKLGKPFAFVLNQTPPRGGRIGEAAMALNSAGALALPYVGQRIDHQDALPPAWRAEFAPDSKAAAESAIYGDGSGKPELKLGIANLDQTTMSTPLSERPAEVPRRLAAR